MKTKKQLKLFEAEQDHIKGIVLKTIKKNLTIMLCITAVVSCSKSDSDPDPNPEPDPNPVVHTITAIAPTSGAVGTEVTITGTNFSSTAGENAITFNGTASAATSASSTQLNAKVPEGTTTGPVAVTIKGKSVNGPTFTILTGDASLCNQIEIIEDTIWEDVEAGDAVDYVVQCAISVKGNALLTIRPGVIIAFEGAESGIFATEGGGIKAIGTEADPIKLQGTSENKGVWKGIYFASNHPENRLENVSISHAGRTASGQSGEKGAVQLTRGDESGAAIVNCSITDNDGFGIYVTDEADLDDFSGNTITDNEGSPIGLYFNQLGILDGDSDYRGNGKDYVEIRQNDIEDEDVAMAMLNVPYRFVESKKYNVNRALTISPGSVLEFTNGSGFRLGEQAADCITTTGSLNATGTAQDHIIFKGIVEGKGTWLGLGFNSSSPNNKLIYCDISGGGSDKIYNGSQFSANIALQCESRVSIQQTSITDSGAFGIYMDDPDAKLEDFEENALINNELAPILLHLPQVDQLDTASSYAEGNGRAYIQVFGRAVKDADLTLAKLEVPYRIAQDEDGRVTYVERALTILPGVIMEFETAAGIILGNPSFDCTPLTGSLNAEGSAEEPIIFKGVTDGQGTWRGIGINSSAATNLLKYCEISGGGASQMYNAGGQGNIVIHCQGALNLENSTIKDSGSWGIDFVQGGNSLTDTNNTFVNNADGNIAPN